MGWGGGGGQRRRVWEGGGGAVLCINLANQMQEGYRGGTVSIVSHVKLISVLILKEPYSIEKCATCLDTFLRF